VSGLFPGRRAGLWRSAGTPGAGLWRSAGTRGAGLWRSARGLRATPAYLGVVTAGVATLSALSPENRRRVLRACSTNVENLGRGRWWTLLASVLVMSRLYAAGLVPLSLVLVLAELYWGWWRLATMFLAGHVLATLLVYAVLRIGLARGRVPREVASAVDVGASYGWAATLGGLAMTLPWGGNTAHVVAAVAFVAVFAAELARQRTFTDLGHLVALVLGIAAGAGAGRQRLNAAA
jgi:hypothetical protein